MAGVRVSAWVAVIFAAGEPVGRFLSTGAGGGFEQPARRRTANDNLYSVFVWRFLGAKRNGLFVDGAEILVI